jgi:hypothetical protein
MANAITFRSPTAGAAVPQKTENGKLLRPGDVTMPPECPKPETYLKELEHLKTVFPVPVSNPVLDGYFVHTVSQFLDLVDDLKSSAPLLGKVRS